MLETGFLASVVAVASAAAAADCWWLLLLLQLGSYGCIAQSHK